MGLDLQVKILSNARFNSYNKEKLYLVFCKDTRPVKQKKQKIHNNECSCGGGPPPDGEEGALRRVLQIFENSRGNALHGRRITTQ